jgi:transketolase
MSVQNGPTNEIKNLEPLAQKWAAFGWNVLDIDGHSIEALKAAFDAFNNTKGKPTVIIANTVKGKGISFMEGKCGWHGKAPNKEQLAQALAELK